MTRDTLAFFILIAFAIIALLLIERRVSPPVPDERIVINAQATTQPALCYPLPTPLDRPKRALTAKLGGA